MARVARIYFNAVFGAVGGLLGWLLFGVFGDRNYSSIGQLLLSGALIGGLIGYLVVSVEAIRDRSLVRFCRLASYGVVLGAVGGALGMWLGDRVNFLLVSKLGAGQSGGPSLVHLLGTVLARGLGWMFLGLAIGVSEGIAARSLGKLTYGTLGGAVGGFVGGAVFALFYQTTIEKGPAADAGSFGGALGLVVLGACIGS